MNSENNQSRFYQNPKFVWGIVIVLSLQLVVFSAMIVGLMIKNQELRQEIGNLNAKLAQEQSKNIVPPQPIPDLEAKPEVFVFFELEASEVTILELQDMWADLEGVSSVDYISSSEAKQLYLATLAPGSELYQQALKTTLPASLEFTLEQDGSATKLLQRLQMDIKDFGLKVKEVKVVEN
jgi:hypothetical protein